MTSSRAIAMWCRVQKTVQIRGNANRQQKIVTGLLRQGNATLPMLMFIRASVQMWNRKHLNKKIKVAIIFYPNNIPQLTAPSS